MAKSLQLQLGDCPSNEYLGLISSGLTDFIFLQAKEFSRVFSSTTIQKHQFSGTYPSLWSNSLLYTTTRKIIALTVQNLVSKVMSLLFYMLSRFVVTFLSRRKGLWISWLQLPFIVILKPKKTKFVTVSIVFPTICHKVMGPGVMILVFWILNFKSAFPLFSFTFIKRLFSFSSLAAIRLVSSAYLRLLTFSPGSWFQLLIHPTWNFAWYTLNIS